MSKLRVRGTLVALVLFATVAVFPGVVQARKSKQATHHVASCASKNMGVLVADGTDPYPKPPVPWASQSA